MNPEQEAKLNEIYEFMQSLKNSATIPYEIDASFRDRFITNLVLSDFGVPNDIANAPRTAVTAPSGGGTQDAEARTAINSVITKLEELGLVEEN